MQVKNVKDGRPMRGMALTEEAKNRIWRIMRQNGIISESEHRSEARVRDPQVLELEAVH